MPALAKILHVLGLLGKAETTNYTAVSVSNTTDGIELQYANRYQGAPMEFQWLNDGDLGPAVSALGNVAGVAPTGFMLKGDLPFRSRPSGVAYSASVVPSGHRMLQAGGLVATGSFGAGTETWTYTPSPAGLTYTTLSAELYTAQEKWAIAGLIGSLKFDAPDTKPPIWTLVGAQGIPTLPVDSAMPAITYPDITILPPLSSSIALTIGSLTSANVVVYNHSFDFQRQLKPRVAQSGSGGYLGSVPGDFNPILVVEIERTAAVVGAPYTSSTAIDPIRLKNSGQVLALTLVKGSTQYFKETINFPQCQVIDVKPSNQDAIPTWKITFRANNSTPSANDSFSIVYA